MAGGRARVSGLFVPAIAVGPKRAEPWTWRGMCEACLYLRPGGRPVLTHIFPSGLIGDSLKVECPEEPIEDRGCLSSRDGLTQAGTPDFFIDVVEKGQRASKFTDGSDEQHGAINRGRESGTWRNARA